MKKITV